MSKLFLFYCIAVVTVVVWSSLAHFAIIDWDESGGGGGGGYYRGYGTGGGGYSGGSHK